MADPAAVPIKEKPIAETKKTRSNEASTTLGSETKFDSYENTKGVPFAADYLRIGDYYKNDMMGDVQPKVNRIMSYLKKSGDFAGIGGEILDTIMSKLNIGNDVSVLARLDRIYYYVVADERITPLKEKRKKIEESIEKQMSDELKKLNK